MQKPGFLSIKVIKNVLTNPQYSFVDKLNYFSFLLIGLAGLFLVLFEFFAYFRFSIWGLLCFSVTMARWKSVYDKFVIPYAKSQGDEVYNQALKQEKILEYSQQATFNPHASSTSRRESKLISLSFLLVFLITVFVVVSLVFHIPKELTSLVFIIFIILFGVILVFLFIEIFKSIKEAVGIYKKTVQDISAIQNEGMPVKTQIKSKKTWIITLIIIVVFALISLNRYQAITGKNIFLDLDINNITTQNLASDKYVLLQVATLPDNLTTDNNYSGKEFVLDKQNKTLQINFLREKDKFNYYNFNDPKDILLIIINKDFLNLGVNDYYLSSDTQLPHDLAQVYEQSTLQVDKPKITKIGEKGELYIESERYDLSVAEKEKNMQTGIGVDYKQGVVKEVVTVYPSQSFDFINDQGKLVKLFNLGIFPKSGISFVKPSPTPVITKTIDFPTMPSVYTPLNIKGIAASNIDGLINHTYEIAKGENNWYKVTGSVTNTSGKIIKNADLKISLIDASNNIGQTSEEPIHTAEMDSIQPGEEFLYKQQFYEKGNVSGFKVEIINR